MIKILSVTDSTRRNQARKEVEKLNIKNWSFYDAVNLKNIEKYKFDVTENLYGREITPEEKSCSISHHNIIKDDSTYIVLEDDLKVIKSIDLICILEYINKQKKPIVIILGHSKTSQHDFWMQNLKQPLIHKVKICSQTIGINYRINFYGTLGYMFNDEFKKSMSKIPKTAWVADDWITIKRYSGCEIYQLKDKIVVEDLNKKYISSISNRVHYRHDTRKKLLINILKAMRAQIIYIYNKRYFDENSNNT